MFPNVKTKYPLLLGDCELLGSSCPTIPDEGITFISCHRKKEYSLASGWKLSQKYEWQIENPKWTVAPSYMMCEILDNPSTLKGGS